MKRTLATMMLLPVLGHASIAAGFRQILCSGGSNSIVVARVEGGVGADCRLAIKTGCSDTNVVRLSVVVREMLAVGKDDPVLGPVPGFLKGPVADVIGRMGDIYVHIVDSQCYVPDSPIEIDLPSTCGNLPGPTSQALTDEDVKALYAGKTFIFSIPPQYHGRRLSATAWPMESRAVVMQALHEDKGGRCPLPYDDGRGTTL